MSALDRRTDAAFTETRRRGPVRRIFRALGWTLLALVLVILATLAGAIGVLQTGWGKREIASLASGALSGEGKTAEITGIEGLLPFDMRVDRVRLGEPQGHWLEVDGARLHLVPSALLHLKVEIAAVGAERVAPRPTTAISGTNRPPLKMNAEQKDLAARLLAEGKPVKEVAKTGAHVSAICRLSDVGVV